VVAGAVLARVAASARPRWPSSGMGRPRMRPSRPGSSHQHGSWPPSPSPSPSPAPTRSAVPRSACPTSVQYQPLSRKSVAGSPILH